MLYFVVYFVKDQKNIMHETRFVNEVFIVLRQRLGAGKDVARVAVNVRLSPFSHVTAEGLRDSFKELIQGETFKEASLNVLPLELLLECRSCKRSARIDKRVFACPFCGSADLNIPMDREFFVESLDIDRD